MMKQKVLSWLGLSRTRNLSQGVLPQQFNNSPSFIDRINFGAIFHIGPIFQKVTQDKGFGRHQLSIVVKGGLAEHGFQILLRAVPIERAQNVVVLFEQLDIVIPLLQNGRDQAIANGIARAGLRRRVGTRAARRNAQVGKGVRFTVFLGLSRSNLLMHLHGVQQQILGQDVIIVVGRWFDNQGVDARIAAKVALVEIAFGLRGRSLGHPQSE
mmetsp:Transcript_24674/g.56542  ORF Transcript_24674/g.56542 Transcript_24674/m.56542 type:complete len:212 (+) Transcript_24674:1470-2105(+)